MRKGNFSPISFIMVLNHLNKKTTFAKIINNTTEPIDVSFDFDVFDEEINRRYIKVSKN